MGALLAFLQSIGGAGAAGAAGAAAPAAGAPAAGVAAPAAAAEPRGLLDMFQHGVKGVTGTDQPQQQGFMQPLAMPTLGSAGFKLF